MGKFSTDDLRAVVGAREASRIEKLIEANNAPDVYDDQLEALSVWLNDPSKLGHSTPKVMPALRAYYHAFPKAKIGIKRWLTEMGVK